MQTVKPASGSASCVAPKTSDASHPFVSRDAHRCSPACCGDLGHRLLAKHAQIETTRRSHRPPQHLALTSMKHNKSVSETTWNMEELMRIITASVRRDSQNQRQHWDLILTYIASHILRLQRLCLNAVFCMSMWSEAHVALGIELTVLGQKDPEKLRSPASCAKESTQLRPLIPYDVIRQGMQNHTNTLITHLITLKRMILAEQLLVQFAEAQHLEEGTLPRSVQSLQAIDEVDLHWNPWLARDLSSLCF